MAEQPESPDCIITKETGFDKVISQTLPNTNFIINGTQLGTSVNSGQSFLGNMSLNSNDLNNVLSKTGSSVVIQPSGTSVSNSSNFPANTTSIQPLLIGKDQQILPVINVVQKTDNIRATFKQGDQLFLQDTGNPSKKRLVKVTQQIVPGFIMMNNAGETSIALQGQIPPGMLVDPSKLTTMVNFGFPNTNISTKPLGKDMVVDLTEDDEVQNNLDKDKQLAHSKCKVCGAKDKQNFCEDCQAFFDIQFRKPVRNICKKGGNCDINTYTRDSCQDCRYIKCIKAGICPTNKDKQLAHSKCKVCGAKDKQNFCEDCQAFFDIQFCKPVRNICQKGGNCDINTYTRDSCQDCRYIKCIKAGICPTKKAYQSKCQVCGDVAKCLHCGVLMCDVCRLFVKESEHTYHQFKCISDLSGQNCVIDKWNRASCPYCRLKKYLRYKSLNNHQIDLTGQNSTEHIDLTRQLLTDTSTEQRATGVHGNTQTGVTSQVREADKCHSLPPKSQSDNSIQGKPDHTLQETSLSSSSNDKTDDGAPPTKKSDDVYDIFEMECYSDDGDDDDDDNGSSHDTEILSEDNIVITPKENPVNVSNVNKPVSLSKVVIYDNNENYEKSVTRATVNSGSETGTGTVDNVVEKTLVGNLPNIGVKDINLENPIDSKTESTEKSEGKNKPKKKSKRTHHSSSSSDSEWDWDNPDFVPEPRTTHSRATRGVEISHESDVVHNNNINLDLTNLQKNNIVATGENLNLVSLQDGRNVGNENRTLSIASAIEKADKSRVGAENVKIWLENQNREKNVDVNSSAVKVSDNLNRQDGKITQKKDLAESNIANTSSFSTNQVNDQTSSDKMPTDEQTHKVQTPRVRAPVLPEFPLSDDEESHKEDNSRKKTGLKSSINRREHSAGKQNSEKENLRENDKEHAKVATDNEYDDDTEDMEYDNDEISNLPLSPLQTDGTSHKSKEMDSANVDSGIKNLKKSDVKSLKKRDDVESDDSLMSKSSSKSGSHGKSKTCKNRGKKLRQNVDVDSDEDEELDNKKKYRSHKTAVTYTSGNDTDNSKNSGSYSRKVKVNSSNKNTGNSDCQNDFELDPATGILQKTLGKGKNKSNMDVDSDTSEISDRRSGKRKGKKNDDFDSDASGASKLRSGKRKEVDSDASRTSHKKSGNRKEKTIMDVDSDASRTSHIRSDKSKGKGIMYVDSDASRTSQTKSGKKKRLDKRQVQDESDDENSDDSKRRRRQKKKRNLQRNKCSSESEDSDGSKKSTLSSISKSSSYTGTKKPIIYVSPVPSKPGEEIRTVTTELFSTDALRSKQKKLLLRGCFICGKLFADVNYMWQHISSNHSYYINPEKFLCTHCGELFKTLDKLFSHEVVEHGFDYACQFCGIKCKSESSRLDHFEHQHMKSDTYLCKTCKKDFRTKSAVQVHTRNTHQDKEGWINCLKCHFCKEMFLKLTSLFNHVLKDHWELFTFLCKSCGQLFHSMLALRRHRSDKNNCLDGSYVPTEDDNYMIKFVLPTYAGKVNSFKQEMEEIMNMSEKTVTVTPKKTKKYKGVQERKSSKHSITIDQYDLDKLLGNVTPGSSTSTQQISTVNSKASVDSRQASSSTSSGSQKSVVQADTSPSEKNLQKKKENDSCSLSEKITLNEKLEQVIGEFNLGNFNFSSLQAMTSTNEKLEQLIGHLVLQKMKEDTGLLLNKKKSLKKRKHMTSSSSGSASDNDDRRREKELVKKGRKIGKKSVDSSDTEETDENYSDSRKNRKGKNVSKKITTSSDEEGTKTEKSSKTKKKFSRITIDSESSSSEDADYKKRKKKLNMISDSDSDNPQKRVKKSSKSKIGPKSSKNRRNLSASSESDIETSDFVNDSEESEPSIRITRTMRQANPNVIANSKPGPKSSKTDQTFCKPGPKSSKTDQKSCKPGPKSSKPGLKSSESSTYKPGPKSSKPGPKSSKPGPKSSKSAPYSSKSGTNKPGPSSSKKTNAVSDSSDTDGHLEDIDDHDPGLSFDEGISYQQETTRVHTRGRKPLRDSKGKFIKKHRATKAHNADYSSEESDSSKSRQKMTKSVVEKTKPSTSKAQTRNVSSGNERSSARLHRLSPVGVTKKILAHGQTSEKVVGEKVPDKSKPLPNVIPVSEAKTALAAFPKPRIILERSIPASEIRKLSPVKNPSQTDLSAAGIKEKNVTGKKTKIVEKFVDPLDGKEREWEIEDDSGGDDDLQYSDIDDDEALDSDDDGVEQNNITKNKSVNIVQNIGQDSLLMDCETIKLDPNIDGTRMEIDDSDDDVDEHSRNVLINPTPEEIDIGDIPALVVRKDPESSNIKSEHGTTKSVAATKTTNVGVPVSTPRMTNIGQSVNTTGTTTAAAPSVMTTKTTTAHTSPGRTTEIPIAGMPVSKLTNVKREQTADGGINAGHSGTVKIKQEPVEQEVNVSSAPKRLKLVQVFSIPGVKDTTNPDMTQKHCPTTQVDKNPIIPQQQSSPTSRVLKDPENREPKEDVSNIVPSQEQASTLTSQVVKEVVVKDTAQSGPKQGPKQTIVQDKGQSALKQTPLVHTLSNPARTALQGVNILRNANIEAQSVSKKKTQPANSITVSETSASPGTSESRTDDKELPNPRSLNLPGNFSQHDKVRSENKSEDITISIGNENFKAPVPNLNKSPVQPAPILVREINLGLGKETNQLSEGQDKPPSLRPQSESTASTTVSSAAKENNLTSGQDEPSNSRLQFQSAVDKTVSSSTKDNNLPPSQEKPTDSRPQFVENSSSKKDNYLTASGGVLVYTKDHLKKMTHQCLNDIYKQNKAKTAAMATPPGAASLQYIGTIKNVQPNTSHGNIVEMIKNQLIEKRNKKIVAGMKVSPLPSNLSKIIYAEIQTYLKGHEASSTINHGGLEDLQLPSTSPQTSNTTTYNPSLAASQSNIGTIAKGNTTQENIRPVQPPQGNLQPSQQPMESFQPSLPPQGNIRPNKQQPPPQGNIGPSLQQPPPQGNIRPSLPPHGNIRPSLQQPPPQGNFQPSHQQPSQGNIRSSQHQLTPQGNIRPNQQQPPPQGNIRPNQQQPPPQGYIRPSRPLQGNIRPTQQQQPTQGNFQPSHQQPPQGNIRPNQQQPPPQGNIRPSRLLQGNIRPTQQQQPTQGNFQPSWPPQRNIGPSQQQQPSQGNFQPSWPPQKNIGPSQQQQPSQGNFQPSWPPQRNIGPSQQQQPPQGNFQPSWPPQRNIGPSQQQPPRNYISTHQNIKYRPGFPAVSSASAATRLPHMLSANVSGQPPGLVSSQLQSVPNSYQQQESLMAIQSIAISTMPLPQQVATSMIATSSATQPTLPVPTQQENKAPIDEASLLQGYYK